MTQPIPAPLPVADCRRIRDWPVDERPREKLLQRGARSLSDAELLAVFLGSGLSGQDAVSSARQLLAQHGPLRHLLERSPAQLTELPGIGPARAAALAAALELGDRCLAAELERGLVMNDAGAAGTYFARRLRGHRHEVFAALFLDTRHRAIAFDELFHGTIDSATVHPRELVRRALAYNAAAVMVGHNHPSGNPQPSHSDRVLTAQLKQALQLLDIRLLDHFVIGDGMPTSMAAAGWV